MHETPGGRTASNGPGQVSRRGLLVGSGLVLGGAATGVLSPARARAGTGSFPDGAGTTAGTEVPAVEVRPGDPRYPALTTGFNQRFSGTPAYVAVVTTPEQCLAAVGEAVAAGRRITVRGGGHCYEGFVCDNPGGVIIDLSGMRAIAQDRDGGVALQGGCTNWDVYELLYKSYGVTLPGGSCYSVGLGGHVVGGGGTFGVILAYHFRDLPAPAPVVQL